MAVLSRGLACRGHAQRGADIERDTVGQQYGLGGRQRHMLGRRASTPAPPSSMIPAPSLCGMIGEAISSPEAALRRLMSVGLMPDALMRMSASPRAGTGLGPLSILRPRGHCRGAQRPSPFQLLDIQPGSRASRSGPTRHIWVALAAVRPDREHHHEGWSAGTSIIALPPSFGASFCWTATTARSGRHATVMLSTRPASFRCM